MHNGFHSIFKIHKIRKELKEVYANVMIDKFAASLITIFIPIYLLTIGYSIPEALSLLLFVEMTIIFLAIPAAFLSSKAGLKHTILYKTPVTLLFILLLYNIPSGPASMIYIAVVGIMWGISRTFYWIALNSEFVGNSDKIHRGEETGFLFALPVAISVGGPLLGGLMLQFMGFGVLFTLFSVMLIISVIPLFLTQDYRKLFKFRKKDIKFRLGNRFNLGFFAQGFTFIGEVIIWPFYIYITLGDVISTAASVSLSVLGVVFFTFVAGKFADRINRRKMLSIGAVGYFIVCILRYFAGTNLEFFVLSFLGGLLLVLMRIPIFASFSDKANENNILNYVSQRELFLSLGRAVLMLIMVLGIIGVRASLIVIGLLALVLVLIKIK